MFELKRSMTGEAIPVFVPVTKIKRNENGKQYIDRASRYWTLNKKDYPELAPLAQMLDMVLNQGGEFRFKG